MSNYKYLRLTIRNIEPLMISDDSTSHSGQTSCKKYIPGTTIRGFVINRLSGDPDFEQMKPMLFSSDICFLNGYPVQGDSELLPTLKGFYENKKASGPIKNVVVDGCFDEGMKRASLGNFCAITPEHKLRFFTVQTEDSMKIRIGSEKEDQKVFRSEALVAGYTFISYIKIKDDPSGDKSAELRDKIKTCLTDETNPVILGNRRSQGYGKCDVTVDETEAPGYFPTIPNEGFSDHVYMILVSDLVMRNQVGEYCGLDMAALAGKLKISASDNWQPEFCSTSQVMIHGYNAKLGIKLPTVPMYEKGSVFKLRLPGVVDKETLETLMHEGIGEKKNEGFGRVLFLGEEYEQICEKEKGTIALGSKGEAGSDLTDEDKCVIRSVAKNYYRNLLRKAAQKKIPKEREALTIAKSQVGNVLSLLQNNRYSDKVGKKVNAYFEHALEKEDQQSIHQSRGSVRSLKERIQAILDKDINQVFGITQENVMGIKTEELLDDQEKLQFKVAYAIDLLKFERKGE